MRRRCRRPPSARRSRGSGSPSCAKSVDEAGRGALRAGQHEARAGRRRGPRGSPNCSTTGGSSSGGAGCRAAPRRTRATRLGATSLTHGGRAVPLALLRVDGSDVGRVPDMPACAPAPCSDPDRPTPTRRPPSPSGSRCSGHLDPVFLGILDETSDRLRQVFGTTNRRTLPLSATGSAGMEAAFVNTVGPGRRRRRRGQRPVRSADGRRRLAVRGRGRRASSTSGGSRSTPTRVLDGPPGARS